MPTEKVTHEFNATVRKARMEFLRQVEPLRPELYAFCRSLARNVWDAEDLLQDMLLKAFGKLAEVHWDVDNPRACLFRMATNLWIDYTRKHRESAMPENYDAEVESADLKPEVRDVLRFTQDRGGLQTLRYYFFCPETLTEVVAELGLPLKDNGY